MHHNFQILVPSFIIAVALLAIITAKVGFSGYASTLGGRQFGYRFDKRRLPRWRYTLMAIMGICFIYAWLVTGQVGGGLGFCVIVLPFAVLSTLLSVCYVPRNSKNKPTGKGPSGTSKNN